MVDTESLFGIALIYERVREYNGIMKRVEWHEKLVGVEAHGKCLALISDTTSRAIYGDGSIVVKVDRFTPQANGEAATWAELEPEDRQYFAALLEVHDGYVVQEFVPLVKPGDSGWKSEWDEEALYRQAKRLFHESGYSFGWDWQGWPQFGVDARTGTLVIHDYTSGRYTTKHRFTTLQLGRAA